MAAIAYSCISTGLVSMKKGIQWMTWKGKRDKSFYQKLTLWLTGFLVMNIYGVPSAIALKYLPPHTVAAFAGWGIVLLVFLSHWCLKEQIFRSDYLLGSTIVIGIILLNLSESAPSTIQVNRTGMFIFCILPGLLFILGFNKTLSSKSKTILFALVSGISAGLMVISLKILVMLYQYRVTMYFNSEYLYLYIGAALLSFIALQIACKNGPMLIVGPVQYSGNIIYPAVSALLVFGHWLPLIQIGAVAIIVFSVIVMLRKH